LYDYWFTQFDFPDENGKPYRASGGAMVWCDELQSEIPKGLKVSTLSDIAVLQA
jgi:type I restriction enzyme S subunit